MSALPSQISDLSITEKYELLDAFWEDIEAHAPELTDEQAAKLSPCRSTSSGISNPVILGRKQRS